MWIRIRIMGGLLDPDLDSEAKNSQKFARKSAENLNLKLSFSKFKFLFFPKLIL